MDLALEERIDTDLEQLFIVNATPVGDGLLHPSLAEISDTSDMHGDLRARPGDPWLFMNQRTMPWRIE